MKRTCFEYSEIGLSPDITLPFASSVNNNHARVTPIKVARKSTSSFNKLNL